MQAAQMFEQDVRPSRVAEVLRVSVKSACAWHRAWQAGGADALVSKGPAGQTCRLDQTRLQRLEAELDAVPAAHGWADQRWTLDRVAALIGELFGVYYTQKGISVLLHRLGWSPQVSAHRAIERHQEAIDTWVKETWPASKDGGLGRVGLFRRRGRPDSETAPSAHLVPAGPHPGHASAGQGVGESSDRGLGVLPAGPPLLISRAMRRHLADREWLTAYRPTHPNSTPPRAPGPT
ncbi:helix-turn-helix domain-containing protein [Actinocorallia libanotica]